jgi:hypothetical protein
MSILAKSDWYISSLEQLGHVFVSTECVFNTNTSTNVFESPVPVVIYFQL